MLGKRPQQSRRYQALLLGVIYGAILLLAAGAAQAQTGLLVGAVSSEGLGYVRPAPAAGVSTVNSHLQATAWVAPLRKQSVGNGWVGWAQACAPVVRGFGPAALLRYTRNSQWHRAALYPSACWSGAFGPVRVTATAHLRDPWSVYHGRGGSLGWAYDLWARVSIHGGLTVLRFRSFTGVSLFTGVAVNWQARHLTRRSNETLGACLDFRLVLAGAIAAREPGSGTGQARAERRHAYGGGPGGDPRPGAEDLPGRSRAGGIAQTASGL